MHQLLTISPLQKIDWEIRRWLKFYAPLTESLDVFGLDPVIYTRAGTLAVTQRGGARTIAANIPAFEFDGEMPLGFKITTGATLQFNEENELDDANTVIWCEESVWKSTPTNSNPISNSGHWAGNFDVHVKHLVKAKRVLANSEINIIQSALEDVIPEQVIPPPPPPVGEVGTLITEVPTHIGGGVYTASQDVDVNSLLVFTHGGLSLMRVASNPQQLQYTFTAPRTITPGLAPSPANQIFIHFAVLVT